MTYTPTTAEVKDAYVRTTRNAFITSTGEHAAEFDRWLETVQHFAWNHGCVTGASRVMRRMSDEPNAPEPVNPYSAHPLGPQEDPTDDCD